MEELGIYGKVLRRYEGGGVLTFEDGESIQCSFQSVQLTNANIVARCFPRVDLEAFGRLINRGLSGKHAAKSLQGTTVEGYELVMQGNMLLIEQVVRFSVEETIAEPITLYLLANEMDVRFGQEQPLGNEMHFGITNFCFIGLVPKRFPGHRVSRVLPLTVGNTRVVMEPVPDYRAVVKAIRAQRGIDITCEAVVRIDSENDLNGVKAVLDDLCILMSLARGTPINWIYYDIYSQPNHVIATHHRNAVTRSYGWSPLIDEKPEDTKYFLETTCGSFVEQKETYALDWAIDAYLDAKSETAYLQTRALTAVVVMEMLKSRFVDQHGMRHIINEQDFKNNLGRLREGIRQVVQECFPEINTSQLRMMIDGVDWMNEKSFRASLKSMFDRIGLAYTMGELQTFVDSRNALVHRGDFHTENRREEYFRIINLLDRVLLKMLDYDYYYLDARNQWQRVRLE